MSTEDVLTADDVSINTSELEAMSTLGDADAPAEKLAQKVDIRDAGPCKKHVKVTVDGAAIRTRFDEKYSEMMVNTPAQVPGFRHGKAPRKIVEKKYAKEVTADVRTEVLMASLEQLADEELLSPLAPPQLDPNSVVMPEDGGDMVYEFDIEVRPEFDLPEYKGLKIRRPIHNPSDADVDREMKRMLEPLAELVDKSSPDGGTLALELEDVMVSDLTIRDGVRDLNHVTDVRLKVEKRLALDDGVAEDFGAVMVGAQVGDERTVEILLTPDVAAETDLNRRVNAIFKVKGIKSIQVPALTTEVLAKFNVRTPEAFDILARTRLDRMLEYQQRQEARQQVLQLLAGKADWQLPQDLLQRQARKTLSRKVMEMRSSGIDEVAISRRQRVLAQDAIRSTATALKEHFVLQKIAEVEKLEIEDADIDAEIDAIADRTNETPRRVKARLQREDMMEVLATDLLERKALDLILESAEYDDYDKDPNSDDDGGGASPDTFAPK